MASSTLTAEFTIPQRWHSNRRGPIRWIISHFLRHWGLGTVIAIGALGNAILAAAVPVLVASFNHITDSPPQTQPLVQLALIIASTQIVRGVLQFGRNFGAEATAQLIERNIREELYISLLGKSMTFHNLQPVGDTMARATNDVREVNFLFSPGVSLVLGSANFMIMPIVLAPRYHPALMLVPTLYIIGYFLALWQYLRELSPVTKEVRLAFGQLNTRLAEALDGIETVKGMAQEHSEVNRFGTNARRFRDATVHQGDIEARFLPLLLLVLAEAGGLLHAILLYRDGLLNIGDVVAYFGLIQLFGFPTFVSLFAYSQLSLGVAGARRILELINRETELDQNVAGYDDSMRGEVELRGVTFTYDESDPALEDITFRVQPGQTVAIVGQTGSGKTSLVKLINRTYDTSLGQVLVDGIDVREWNLETLRRSISIIEQDIFLFSRTISENIAFGKPDATQSDIEVAARAAQAHEFITSFKDGYDTVLGERGVTLSGGQRQRLALARAFLTDPRILVLDDSTSSIDSATEDNIQRAIYAAARGRTTFIITHRLSQIRWADLIIVMRQGRISAIGSHTHLLETSTAYRSIFTEERAGLVMGFFSSLDLEGYDRKYTDRQLIRRMMDYFLPHRRRLIVIIILLILMAASGAAVPLIVSRGVDLISDDPPGYAIGLLFLSILGTGLVNWGANWLRRRLTVRTISDIELTLRTDAFRAASDHDLSFYDEFSSGRIVSRITSDTKDFGQVVVLITDLIAQIFQALVLGIVLVSIEWRLSLYLFGFLPIIFLVAMSFRRLARSATRAGMRAMATVNATIKETVSGISVAKNFRQEISVFDEFNEANFQSFQVNLRRGLLLSMVFPTLNALGGIGTATLVYVGGLNTAQGVVTAGAWYLFLQSLDRFFFPVLNLSAFWAQVQNGLSAAERIFALIDAEAAVVQTDQQPVYHLKGDIRFDNIWFRYTEQEQVLCDFSLHIHAGENVALVGHTGAGKSSIAKLIARLYEFQRGQILADGRDIRTFDLSAYRSQLGIVSQIPFLFSGTVAENICYACPRETDVTAIEDIARQIGNGKWLSTLPQGLNTEVGERGSRLSMGQRQLVSLMRVLVQRPAIFILDEATASIDPFTEWQIQQALNLILANTTSILIAHRLSTVKAADRIIVLEDGQIIEEGNHTSLLAQDGHYADLYNTYFRHQSLEYVEQARELAKAAYKP